MMKEREIMATRECEICGDYLATSSEYLAHVVKHEEEE
jgi:hypothetical protein